MTDCEFRDWANSLIQAQNNIRIACNTLALAGIVTPQQEQRKREAETLLTEAKVLINDALATIRG